MVRFTKRATTIGGIRIPKGTKVVSGRQADSARTVASALGISVKRLLRMERASKRRWAKRRR